MPSSKNYKRDYKQEGKYQATAKQRKNRAARNRAHALLEKHLGRNIKGDVDHKRPISKGGNNKLKNLRVQSKSKNRSFARTKSAGYK